jgi:hypothetical protein
VACVEVSEIAVGKLDRMIVTHSLPANARARVRRCLRVLEEFPRIGRQLDGQWEGLRVVLGPWRWMLIVCCYEEAGDVVQIVTIEDARASTAVAST